MFSQRTSTAKKFLKHGKPQFVKNAKTDSNNKKNNFLLEFNGKNL